LRGATIMSGVRYQEQKLERIFHAANEPVGAAPADQAAICSK
jgi:hypothetical protein